MVITKEVKHIYKHNKIRYDSSLDKSYKLQIKQEFTPRELVEFSASLAEFVKDVDVPEEEVVEEVTNG